MTSSALRLVSHSNTVRHLRCRRGEEKCVAFVFIILLASDPHSCAKLLVFVAAVPARAHNEAINRRALANDAPTIDRVLVPGRNHNQINGSFRNIEMGEENHHLNNPTFNYRFVTHNEVVFRN